ncbi:class I glutamine amidotransferase-like protein [Dipodascopsis tothii]|uniref:class I glutamine amidotransferase-like protein n=1 Tax=Dipodascopsis tothii TaxID=44089 RepID=UPI0034D00494
MASSNVPKKALIAVTSYCAPFYEDGKKTGLFYTEALHPYEVLVKNGFEVVLASETGTYGIDDHSLSPDFMTEEEMAIFNDPDSEFNQQLKKIKKASDVNPKEFGLFYASAGHASLFDYPTATSLQAIAADIYDRGGVVSAVCHGPAILPGIKDVKTGEPIIKGKTVTGFMDKGEDVLNLTEKINSLNAPTIEKAVDTVGASYDHPAQPFDEFSIIDGRIVTGTNPASATLTAVNAVKAFNQS